MIRATVEAERNLKTATGKVNNTAMNVLLSVETNDILFDIKDYAKQGLKNINDLGALIELTIGQDNNEMFNKLIFTGKYVHGLRTVLGKNVSITTEAQENIKKEFQKNVETLHSHIRDIVSNSDNETRVYFESKYLQITQESMARIMELSEDLAVSKEYYNSQK